MFRQTNDDIEELLKITEGLAKKLKNQGKLQQEAKFQMEKILHDAEAIGGALIKDVKKIQTELGDYLKEPSEKMRVKVMRDAMRIKHTMREL